MTFGLRLGSDDPSAITSRELVVLDGANGVTQAPRLRFPDAAPGLMVALGALLFGAWLLRMKPALAPRALPLLLGLAAIPGLMGVLAVRADAPLKRQALAQTIETTIREIEIAAPWPEAVNVVHEDDDVLFPLARYAIPTRTKHGIELEVRGSKLEATCRSDANRVVCAP